MPFPLYSQGEGGDHVCMSPHPTLMIILISTVPHRRPWFYSWVGKTPWRRDRLPTPVSLGFPCGSAGKESACNAGDLGLVPGLGRSPGEGKDYPLQYSDLGKSMDCIIHGVAKSQTRLSKFHFHFPQFLGKKEVEKAALDDRS